MLQIDLLHPLNCSKLTTDSSILVVTAWQHNRVWISFTYERKRQQKRGITPREPEGKHAELRLNIRSCSLWRMRYRNGFSWMLQKYSSGPRSDAGGGALKKKKGGRKINI
jgi:hypothetical protein